MSEKFNIDRQPGDPLVFNIDLKWSLWSASRDFWMERAPCTFLHLTDGFFGDFDEYGDDVVINTAPHKEIRFGTVTIMPKQDLVMVHFWAEYDDESRDDVFETFPIPDDFDQFLRVVDNYEQRLINLSEQHA